MDKQFDGQHEDEELLFVFRRHIIAMRKGFYALLIPFLLGSIPTLIWPDRLGFLWFALAGFLLGLLLFFYHWVGWYYSIFLVSDQRIRQISQRGLFGKSVIDLGLSKIQNISYNIPGFTGEVFKFGTIVIQTFVGDLVIHKVERPGEIYNKLQDAVHEATKGMRQEEFDEEAN